MEVETRIEKLTLAFEGENYIELETLTGVLDSTLICLKKIANEALTEEEFCKFRVSNVTKGSFVVELEAIIPYIPTLIPVAASVFSTFKTILEIKNLLNGSLPKKVEKSIDNSVTIESCDGGSINANNFVFNMYTNDNDIEKLVAKIYGLIGNDDSRTALAVNVQKDGHTENLNIPKETLKKLSYPLDVESIAFDAKEELQTVNLKIKKPDLQGYSRWDFYLMGNIISAEILDEQFLSDVHSGVVRFDCNTYLTVDLRVVMKVDDKGNFTTKKPSYYVIKVKEINQEHGNV